MPKVTLACEQWSCDFKPRTKQLAPGAMLFTVMPDGLEVKVLGMSKCVRGGNVS